MKSFDTESKDNGVICHDIAALEEALEMGEVHLVYMKKDGSMREAHGTRAAHLIPHDCLPRGTRSPSPLVLTYYDTDRAAWRCLRRDRLLGFIQSPVFKEKMKEKKEKVTKRNE